jgi:hypothetical protein
MPNWKKLIVSGSDASLNTLNVNTALTASGLSYPSADGTANQVITTDGNGVLSFTDASAASPDITGSSLITASLSSNVLTFTKGDASSFNLTLPQGGGSTNLSDTAHLTQSVASQTWSFAHNLDDRIPVLTVFDSNHDVIIPERIEMVDEDNMSIYFSSARTGFASAVVLGVTSSFASTATNADTASYVDFDNIDNKPTLISGSLQIASDISGSFTDLSSSIASDVEDIIDGTTTITSASYAVTSSYSENFNATGSITINGYNLPLTDGVDGQAIITDGDGVLTFDDIKVYTQVKNISGTTLVKGTPVHATASASPPSGNVSEVIAASASLGAAMPATFILDEDVANDTEGRAIAVGYIKGVNTTGFTVGDIVYVGPNGGYTNVKPTGSDLIQNLGVITRVDNTNGAGFIYGSGRSNDVPNILEGYAWVGNSNQVASATATSSFFVTSGSHALNADTASYVDFDNIDNKPTLISGSAQIAEDISGSFTDLSSSLEGRVSDNESSISSLNAATSSYLLNTTDTLDGDLTVTGTVTAQEFHTEYVSSSIIYESGSTQFGDSSDDTHIFSGSVNIDGAVTADSYTGIFTGALSSSAQIASDISGSFTDLSSSLEGRVSANESFSASLDTTLLTLSGSFSGSFVGDGSQLSGVTSYTDADTLSYINTLGVVSGSEQINIGNAEGTASHAVSSSFTLTASYAANVPETSSYALSALSSSYALTASYADSGAGFPFNGDAVITGSFLVSGSSVDFTDATAISGSNFSGSFFGDGTGLSGLGYGDTKKLNQTVAATTWSFSHNMNEQFPTVTVYNNSNEVIQPSKIEGVDAQTLKLYFGSATSGTAVAVVGGVATTQEAGFNRVFTQTSTATTWSFEHNLGNQYPQVIVYDSNDELVIPGKVEAVDVNNLNIYFDTAQSGIATATVGGTALTASYANTLVVTDTLLSSQNNTDIDTGIETVATVSISNYDGAFFDYVAKDGTNYRAGTVMAVWDGSSVQYNDNSTADIGDTSGVSLAVDISGTDARLRATTTSDNWNIKAFIRAI